jgi:hypothetical protein
MLNEVLIEGIIKTFNSDLKKFELQNNELTIDIVCSERVIKCFSHNIKIDKEVRVFGKLKRDFAIEAHHLEFDTFIGI